MVEQITENVNAKLTEINGLIKPYQFAYIPLEYCVLVKKNARYMDKQVFNKLVENIKHDGFLSQIPLALKKSDTEYLILSGNHRVKAAIQAGLINIVVLFVTGIDKDTQLAYQLSHNALIGKDDMAILKELYEEIKDIEKKSYSGLSEMDFPDYTIENVTTINDKDIELHEIKFYFTRVRAEQVLALLDLLEKQNINPDETRLCNLEFAEFVKALTELKKS